MLESVMMLSSDKGFSISCLKDLGAVKQNGKTFWVHFSPSGDHILSSG